MYLVTSQLGLPSQYLVALRLVGCIKIVDFNVRGTWKGLCSIICQPSLSCPHWHKILHLPAFPHIAMDQPTTCTTSHILTLYNKYIFFVWENRQAVFQTTFQHNLSFTNCCAEQSEQSKLTPYGFFLRKGSTFSAAEKYVQKMTAHVLLNHKAIPWHSLSTPRRSCIMA